MFSVSSVSNFSMVWKSGNGRLDASLNKYVNQGWSNVYVLFATYKLKL